ncbi:LytR/AlgR family response regulator transcription factor [Altibacter sp. HG106]|uniref:LytR/AlgR family response regulator transcription factor n=1 Tax=Altibacter sp. HG106 TaxID=3023937 RepID=UPI002350AF48|nr:LytTR family DNA-binding domain-containing protein [Altibacter sp. HG106]MDC7993801.1 LytTR family DNA-binding domain-containing protein [Altibacter sp. HG106]
MYKVLIVDDEAAARKLISEYLADFPELIVLGEVNNGVDAVTQINKFQPDLVFLDVQMPGLTGFEVLHRLEELPKIIFSTAYDQYALKAFDVHAIDYLLKPYTKERFKKAVEKVSFSENQSGLGPLAAGVIMDNPNYPERILVEHNKRFITIATTDIIWIEAYGDYSKLHTEQGVYVSNFGISQLEEKLNPNLFIRVHRSHMVNLKAIAQLDKYAKSYDIKMSNGDVVRVSRGYMAEVKKLMY